MSRQLKSPKYDKIALQNAVHAVKSKSMGYLKASKLYGVPRTTIYDKVVGNSDIDSYQGSPTLLSKEEETRLVKWLTDMSRIGYGRNKQELLDVVQKIIRSDGRPNHCKDDRPGKDWYYGFMKRHPKISLRSPRQLGKERAIIKPEHVEKWFNDFGTFIADTVADPLILLDPTRIYNADETGFSMCPKTGHVLGLKGAKSVYNITASDRSQITVMAGMSAAAHYLRPMIVFAGQRFTRNMLEGFDEAVLGRSENGWMDSELFVSWLKTVFIPDIEQRQVKKPVVLLVDGHRTHMTIEASDVCKDNGIVLYCLLEHASHLMQPCDLRLFSSLKETWKASLREWQIHHVGQYVTKFEFASIFKNAWVNAAKVENAVNGFRDAGLFPLDKGKVLSTDKFQTSILFKKPENRSNEIDKPNEPTDMTTNTSEGNQSEQEVEVQDETQNPARSREENDNETQNEALLPRENLDPISNKSNDNQLHVPHHSSVPPLPAPGTSSPLSKILTIPTPKLTKKRAFKREILPKAITGDEFRKILSEKKRRKEEEETEKQKRKEQRELKRIEKEKEKKVKAEKRLEKKKQKEQEKEKREKMKLIKKKINKSKSEDSESDYSVQDDSDDDVTIDPNKCYKCDGTDDESGWIGCQRCFRFFHRKCTDIDFEFMSEEEVQGFPFECLYC